MAPYDRTSVRLDDETSSWTHVVRHVGRAASVLDLGCWDGLLLATLAAQGGRRGVGVERDGAAAARARARGVEVLEGDLEDDGWPSGLGGRRFDAVVAADVVEHLRDPVRVLRRAVDAALAPGGRVVLSVPNVAHAGVRLGLLLGAFEPADEGILDRTHLHFWTRSSLRDVVRAAGLAVAAETRVERPLQAEVVRRALGRAGLASDALVSFLVDDPDARTFQWVLACERGVEPPDVPRPPPLFADPLRVGDRAMRRHVAKIRRLEERLRVLEAGSPLRWLRYVRLRWRQRRDRDRAAGGGGAG